MCLKDTISTINFGHMGAKGWLAGLICNVFNIDKRWCIELATAFGESFNNDSLDAFQDSCHSKRRGGLLC